MDEAKVVRSKIISKLRAEKATSLEDSELERCLKGCVAGEKLIEIAKKDRDLGGLLFQDIIFEESVKIELRLPVELFSQLKEMSQEMATQDNRATADPYYFTIGEKKKIYGVDSNYDTNGYIWVLDGEELCESDPDWENDDDLRERVEDFEHENPEFKTLDIESTLDGMGAVKCYFRIEDRFKNVFFTEKGIRKHMVANKHHYNSTEYDYVEPAFRNPEMEAVIKLLRLIGKSK